MERDARKRTRSELISTLQAPKRPCDEPSCLSWKSFKPTFTCTLKIEPASKDEPSTHGVYVLGNGIGNSRVTNIHLAKLASANATATIGRTGCPETSKEPGTMQHVRTVEPPVHTPPAPSRRDADLNCCNIGTKSVDAQFPADPKQGASPAEQLEAPVELAIEDQTVTEAMCVAPEASEGILCTGTGIGISQQCYWEYSPGNDPIKVIVIGHGPFGSDECIVKPVGSASVEQHINAKRKDLKPIPAADASNLVTANGFKGDSSPDEPVGPASQTQHVAHVHNHTPLDPKAICFTCQFYNQQGKMKLVNGNQRKTGSGVGFFSTAQWRNIF